MADTQHTIHGVLLNIFDVGVLITGNPGIGKSETALTLITRGHKLIADDIVNIEINSSNVIGSCPKLSQNFMHIRDLGFINIKKLYGNTAVLPSNKIELNIHLEKDKESADIGEINLLEHNIPQIIITSANARKLEILIEAAVLHFLGAKTGYDANIAFVEKQREFVSKDT